MRLFGWANRRGPNGASFGLFKPGDSSANKLAPGSGLEEILRQAMELVLSDKNIGSVAGREIRCGTTAAGLKNIRLTTEWADIELAKKDMDSCRFIWTIPFHNDEEGGSSPNTTAPQEEEAW